MTLLLLYILIKTCAIFFFYLFSQTRKVLLLLFKNRLLSFWNNRPPAQGSCIIPHATHDKKYTVHCPEETGKCNTRAGQHVPKFGELNFQCHKGYTHVEGDTFISICRNGAWYPPIYNCSSMYFTLCLTWYILLLSEIRWRHVMRRRARWDGNRSSVFTLTFPNKNTFLVL